MPVEPIPCADGGDTTPIEVTTCCAPSIASSPLCRADGTTILAVVRSGCVECGEAPQDPAVVGWLDVAGVFTAGPLPADVGPCEAGCVDTVCRQLCDDADGDGEADTTYSELWCIRADGTAELVLTYRDDPSVPYVPLAPVECTYGCPESETIPLCDTRPDGTVVPFLRRYTFLQGTVAFEDVALDGSTPHLVTGTVGACGGTGEGAPCAEQTTPAATLGLCLPDGTPLAVIITRDCATGAVNQDGWLNLATGAYTSGPPPVGAAACGDSRAFELAGLLCDVAPATGDVLGLVLVEYAYNPDGSLRSVRLVNPATGTTYALQGELRHCPAGVGAEQPEQDVTVLCDTAADGMVTAFVRDYRRDPATGQIAGHTDYTLSGTPYAPAGTVGVCGPAAEECRNTSTVLLCDLPAGGTPETAATDTDPTPYYPYPTGAAVVGAQALWDGGTLDLTPGTAPQPGTTGRVNSLAAVLQAPRPACDTGTAHVTVSLTVQQDGPDNGCGQTGHLRLFNGTTQTALTVLPASTPAGYFATLTVEADVPAADLASGAVAFALALDAYDDNPAGCAPSPRRTGWQLSGFTVTAVYDQTGCATQILRNVVTDCETGAVLSVTDTTLGGTPYTVTGEVGQCATAGGTECCPEQPPEPCRNTFTMLLCDESSDVTWTQVSVDQDPGSPTGQGWLFRLSPTDDPSTVATIRVRTSQSDASLPCSANGPRWYGNWTTFIYELDAVAQTIPTLRINALDFDRAESMAMLTGMPDRFGGNAYTTGNGVIRSNTDNGTGYLFFDGPPATFSYRFSGACTAISFDAVSSRTTQFLRTLVTDCETGAVLSVADATLDGRPYETTGDVGQCAPASSPEEPCPVQHVIQECRCDDTDGDGIADTDYLELLAVDCEGRLTSIGTYTDGLTAPYTPVAPIDCEATDQGADPVTAVQARRQQLDPGGTWSAAAWPTLQSVTAVAHGGTGTITTADGTSTLHQGESATWSVARDADAFLTGLLAISAATGTVTITFTTGVTL
ncbi:hypothetical protein [Streptomyces sp. DH8]|uniref:hypothetical protein n=1 Tax=Streptomyces sp. DH8 TaxID=2857008 RepID=UPI001E5E8F76|nr:hypothetical protein [Streptomyces sp. DH8]